MDDLMFGVSLNIWMLWRFWTVMKKRENNTLMSLYIRDWKRGGFYPAQILKGNTVRWIKIPLLDVRDITPPKILNDVLRIPKHQRQWWNDWNDAPTCVSLNVFIVLTTVTLASQNSIFFSSDKREKLKFWGAIMGAKTWIFILGLKPYLLMGMRLRRSKWLGRPQNR